MGLHKTVSPFIDTVVVTIATIALARPSYPIWIGYLLIVSSLSAVQNTRYVVLFSLWAVAAYWSGITIMVLSGRADPSWQLAHCKRSEKKSFIPRRAPGVSAFESPLCTS